MASKISQFPNGKDASGNDVIYVYATKEPVYIVYRDPMRVMVHFATDPRTEATQRAALAALNPLRGQISGLLDSWRRSDVREDPYRGLLGSMRKGRDFRNEARACRYDRRVADALVMGLEGSVSEAVALLTDIRNDVIAERKSIAQTDYLLWAGLTGMLFVVAVWFLSSPGLLPHPPRNVHLIWTGAAAGAIGAFFSIAIGLRNRAILIDLQKWDNRVDAMLRIAVGTIGAGILLCLLLAEWMTLDGVTTKLTGGSDSSAMLMALALGFVAGFSERAVGDLLARAGDTISEEATKRDTELEQAKAAAAVAGHAPLRADPVIPHPPPPVGDAEDQDWDEAVAGAGAPKDVVVAMDETQPITVGMPTGPEHLAAEGSAENAGARTDEPVK